jgi:drug/metabolite transporter (DMT)-like permease
MSAESRLRFPRPHRDKDCADGDEGSVIAVLGGLVAACMFATATLCSSRSSRMIGAGPLLAWVMLVGLLITAPIAIAGGVPDELDADALVWLAISGAGNVLGLLLAYRGLRVGRVGVVAAIVSTEGAVAAVISVVAGEEVRPGAAVALAVIVIGIILAAASRSEGEASVGAVGQGALYGVLAALAFGASLYATARVSDRLPLVWALLPARALGVVAVAIPLALTSRLRLTRRAVPLIVVAGIAEIACFGAFALGARHGIAVSAVLASQFAGLAAVAAYFLFGERLAPTQVAGVVAIALGVAAVTLLTA